MIRSLLHFVVIAVLTMISQLGGLAWLIALAFKRRILAFIIAYAALSVCALWIAPLFGRDPLPCTGDNELRMQSKMYCVLNRHYVAPELKQVLIDFAADVARLHPGTKTLVLDANFPFLTGFPLLPHLSHNDGRKADLAFYYSADGIYLPRTTRSPIGYFAFEPGPTACPHDTVTLRWDLAWLQSVWPDYALDQSRMITALDVLVADPRVGKVFIEPHLKQRFGVHSEKIRFQGCRAARHDDHIHIQL